MFGVSLSYKWLRDGAEMTDPSGVSLSRGAFFDFLRDRGVTSIELRTVPVSADPAEVRSIVRGLWDGGFAVTIHGNVRDADHAVSDVLGPLSGVLADMSVRDGNTAQKLLTVTVHPVPGDDVQAENVRLLNALADEILSRELPVRIALENNRLMPDKSPGDSCALVSACVKAVRDRLEGDPRVGQPRRSDRNCVVGICFDMGHLAWHRSVREPPAPYELPDKYFLRQVIHTHVHAVSPGGSTHFPLVPENRLPLKENLAALGWRYAGVLNLELSFGRFAEAMGPVEALDVSLAALDAAVPPTMRAADDIRAHFVSRMESACSLLTAAPEPGTRFALVQSTFYVFNTNGVGWVMDPVLRLAGNVTDAPSRIRVCLSPAKYILITHDHVDHFEEPVVRAMAGAGPIWVMPDWMLPTARAWGLSDDEIIPVRAGERLDLGGLSVLPFPGRHYRPNNAGGIDELGYVVSAADAPTLLFPGDIRDFDPAGFPAFGDVDAAFAHVWLGDGMCRKSDFPKAPEFIRLFASFGAKKVLFGHLYDAARDDDSMWRVEHAGLLAGLLRKVCPGVETMIPEGGEIIRL